MRLLSQKPTNDNRSASVSGFRYTISGTNSMPTKFVRHLSQDSPLYRSGSAAFPHPAPHVANRLSNLFSN